MVLFRDRGESVTECDKSSLDGARSAARATAVAQRKRGPLPLPPGAAKAPQAPTLPLFNPTSAESTTEKVQGSELEDGVYAWCLSSASLGSRTTLVPGHLRPLAQRVVLPTRLQKVCCNLHFVLAALRRYVVAPSSPPLPAAPTSASDAIHSEDVAFDPLYVAIFSCQGDDPSELTFKKGDMICQGMFP